MRAKKPQLNGETLVAMKVAEDEAVSARWWFRARISAEL
jgi:hypothetical protein